MRSSSDSTKDCVEYWELKHNKTQLDLETLPVFLSLLSKPIDPSESSSLTQSAWAEWAKHIGRILFLENYHIGVKAFPSCSDEERSVTSRRFSEHQQRSASLLDPTPTRASCSCSATPF
ncbi:hypothetical protein TNCV_1641671 [Trichonephila clavipes]|nr:hypothetical protein TNCV_1641671 [Trichonephila clavipes]